VEPTRVLHDRTSPGHRKREDERVEARVVESLTDVTARGDHQPLFVFGHGRERRESLLVFPSGESRGENALADESSRA
jgi:hypothetical protein